MTADPELFERLVMVHRPFVISRFPSWARRPELFDDLMNGVWVIAWQYWPSYSFARGTLTTWLGSIVDTVLDRHMRTDYCHREVFHRELRSLDAGPEDSELWDHEYDRIADPDAADPLAVLLAKQDAQDLAHLRHKLLDATRRMAPQQASAWRRLLDGQTMAEIARADGVSRQAIDSRLDKRRGNLRKIVLRHHAETPLRSL